MGSILFDYIPEVFRPTLDQNTIFKNAFRAVVNTDILTSEDFIPSYKQQCYRFKNKASDYSVSLFLDKKTIIKYKEKFPGFKKYNGIAIGNTSLNRGVSIGSGTSKHIDYFLFDYQNNSPCEDFSICEVFDA